MMNELLWCVSWFPMVPIALSAWNLLLWREGGGLRQRLAGVSILIPARNEEQAIEAAVRAALAASSERAPVGEVLVYDDDSNDQTAQVVRRLAEEDSRVRLISGVPLPAGWIGKPHACERLLEQASEPIVVFQDADVRLLPAGLDRLLGLMEEPALGRVITAVPRQVAGSFAEQLVLPFLILTYTSWLPLRLVEVGRQSSTVAANGQLLALRAEDAKQLGGFAAVKQCIVDDVAFCRHAKKNGYRVVFADGHKMAWCRMYRGASEVWRGFSKNLAAGLGGGVISVLMVSLLYLGCFVVPFLMLPVALADPSLRFLLPSASAAVLGFLVLRYWMHRRYAFSLVHGLFHPLGALFTVVIALNSLIWLKRRRVAWKDRVYGEVVT